MSTRPLADEIRPQSLDEVVGQRHLIGPGGVLRRLIDAGTSANMIFYGPSGTGKRPSPTSSPTRRIKRSTGSTRRPRAYRT